MTEWIQIQNETLKPEPVSFLTGHLVYFVPTRSGLSGMGPENCL